MIKIKVYDATTRILHWLFAALFVGAYSLASLYDDESPNFSYHMLAGILLVTVSLLRLIWGLVGTKYARIINFPLSPVSLLEYFKNILTGSKIRHNGQNPASAWAAIIMWFSALLLGFSGYMMVNGSAKEFYEEVHELFANIFLITAILHISGVIFHSLKFRDQIAFSMITGNKTVDLPEEPVKTRWKSAVALLALFLGFTSVLYRGYDQNTQSLTLFGRVYSLGEHEDDSEEGRENNNGEAKEDDDD